MRKIFKVTGLLLLIVITGLTLVAFYVRIPAK